MRYETAAYPIEGSAALAPARSCNRERGRVISFDDARAAMQPIPEPARPSVRTVRPRMRMQTPQLFRDLTDGTLAGRPVHKATKSQIVGIGAGYTLAAAVILVLGVLV